MSLAKRIISATALVTLAGIIVRLFSIGSAPILTQTLGPSPYGVLALASTVMSLASTLALSGIDMSYSRFSFGRDQSLVSDVERFCWRFAVTGAAAFAALAALSWFLVASGSARNMAVASLVAAGTVFYVFSTMAQTRLRLANNYKRIAVATVVSGAVATLLTIGLALWWRRDEFPLLIGYAAGLLLNIVITGTPSASTFTATSSLTKDERWNIIRLGLATAVTAPMYWVLSSGDRWIIDWYCGKEAVGVYSFIYGIAVTGLVVNTGVIMSWFPESARAYEEDSDAARVSLGAMWGRMAVMLLMVWFVVAAFGGDVVRLLADRRFHAGTEYIPWLAGGVFFYGISHLATTGMMLGKDMKPSAYWWLAGASLNLLLNFYAVKIWNGLGAAITNCLSYAFIAAGILWSSSKILSLRIPWNRIVVAGASLLAAGMASSFPWHESPLASIAFKLPLCGVVSCLVMWYAAPDWMGKLLKTVTGRT